jgi:SAM-dependent methyltransferase
MGSNWRDHFEPWEAGGLLVALPERADGRQHPGLLVIEPGEAFGAGSHPSTRLAMALVAAHVHPGATVYDLGCGTGVLGLGALRLGAARVAAVDIDPAAVVTALANAATNGLVENVTVATGSAEQLPPAPPDLLAANLLLADHRQVAPEVRSRLGQDTVLVLAGILDHQLEDARALYGHGDVLDTARDGDWVAVALRTPRSAPRPEARSNTAISPSARSAIQHRDQPLGPKRDPTPRSGAQQARHRPTGDEQPDQRHGDAARHRRPLELPLGRFATRSGESTDVPDSKRRPQREQQPDDQVVASEEL